MKLCTFSTRASLLRIFVYILVFILPPLVIGGLVGTIVHVSLFMTDRDPHGGSKKPDRTNVSLKAYAIRNFIPILSLLCSSRQQNVVAHHGKQRQNASAHEKNAQRKNPVQNQTACRKPHSWIGVNALGKIGKVPEAVGEERNVSKVVRHRKIYSAVRTRRGGVRTASINSQPLLTILVSNFVSGWL